MNVQQSLSGIFSGVAAKRLTAVETDSSRSNQHEIQGVGALREIFGKDDKLKMNTTFFYLGDSEEDMISDHGFVSWSDVRKGKPRAAEYHLYYSDSSVSDAFTEGDLVVVAQKNDEEVVVIAAKAHSTAESQLLWLFDIPRENLNTFSLGKSDKEIGIAALWMLDQLGVEIDVRDDDLDEMLSRFGDSFPSTSIFSTFAREKSGITEINDPDETLIAFIEKEEQLFRAFEKHLVTDRLDQGFQGDVDGFISFSLSVHNRRKCRVGYALEHHLEFILESSQIKFDRGKCTEGKKKPDFIFPGIDQYYDATFPEKKLSMLGSKSTCKDRWRQVLSEAARIPNKHLLTLEASISEDQTAEMQGDNLQLVVPKSIHETYTFAQQNWLFSLQDFMTMVTSNQ